MFARGRQLSLLSSCALLLVCLLPGQPAAQEVEAAQASSTDVAADQQFVPPSAVLSQPTVSSQKLLAQGEHHLARSIDQGLDTTLMVLGICDFCT